MKKESAKDRFSTEVLAAYLDGNATAKESRAILGALMDDAELGKLLSLSQAVDEDLGLISDLEILPMTAMAASCKEQNYCCLECEKYILSRRKVPFDDHILLSQAVQAGWQQRGGTALHNVGRHLERRGFYVKREWEARMEDIDSALQRGEDVIVAVDGGELLDASQRELLEDIYVGERPDHLVVVLDYDKNRGVVRIYDPNSPNPKDSYPVGQFFDAWVDSKNYLVTIKSKDMNNYTPKPIDLSDVNLAEELAELREAIAENAHEIWALKLWERGWRWGSERNDELLQTPDLVPYAELPEGEKEFDRETVMQTIKLLKKLGYDIVKREDTELYRLFKQRIAGVGAGSRYQCNECGAPVFRHQIYCDKCGTKLEINWKAVK